MDLPDHEPCSENRTALNSPRAIHEVALDCLWDAPIERSPGKLASLAPNHEARASLHSALSWHKCRANSCSFSGNYD
jgi:hypothetical protein